MSSYCDFAPGDPLHGPYHDTEYGFPVTDEAALLERLSLEIFQAGLSWLIILKKRPTIVAAFGGFDAERVAAYGERDRERLLADAGIIRNRRKVDAIIENARRVVGLRESDGGFASWIASNHPLTKEEWVKAFRQAFVFHGRRGGRRVPDQHRISAGRPPRALPGLRPRSRPSGLPGWDEARN